jgi:hypothetical protein
MVSLLGVTVVVPLGGVFAKVPANENITAAIRTQREMALLSVCLAKPPAKHPSIALLFI